MTPQMLREVYIRPVLVYLEECCEDQYKLDYKKIEESFDDKYKEEKLARLRPMKIYSQNAEELLVATPAAESNMGEYIKQIGGGPACGPFQIEPATHDLITMWLKKKKPLLFDRVMSLRVDQHSLKIKNELIYNIPYQVAIARCLYLSIPRPLPAYDDVKGMAIYWKKYYNSPLGKGTIEHFIENYNRLVLGG